MFYLSMSVSIYLNYNLGVLMPLWLNYYFLLCGERLQIFFAIHTIIFYKELCLKKKKL